MQEKISTINCKGSRAKTNHVSLLGHCIFHAWKFIQLFPHWLPSTAGWLHVYTRILLHVLHNVHLSHSLIWCTVYVKQYIIIHCGCMYVVPYDSLSSTSCQEWSYFVYNVQEADWPPLFCDESDSDSNIFSG